MNTTLHRLPDWPDRLHAFVEGERKQPFAWGVRDCCQFPRRGIAALTGTDVAADWALPNYHTAGWATRTVKRLGGIAAIPAKAGLPEVRVSLARRGDLMLCEIDGRPALGLCVGPHCAGPGLHGLVFVRTLSCRQAWRIG